MEQTDWTEEDKGERRFTWEGLEVRVVYSGSAELKDCLDGREERRSG